MPRPSPAASLSAVPRRVAMALFAAVFSVGACDVVSTTPPAATPADFPGITAALAVRGVQVNQFVSGEAGCNDPVLIPTAIAFDAKGLDQPENVRIHIYIFRNRAAFERLRASVDTCAASFVTDPETFETVEASPFVLAGQGPWAPEFEAALRDGLADAAGAGG